MRIEQQFLISPVDRRHPRMFFVRMVRQQMKHLLLQGSAHGTGVGSLRGWTGAAGSAHERYLALVGQRMQMPQAPQPVPCRQVADPALQRWVTVTASAVCHGCAPPWRQVHHTPTVASQPARSFAEQTELTRKRPLA